MNKTNSVVSLWHRYYNKKPKEIARMAGLTQDQLLSSLKGTVSHREYSERIAFTSYSHDVGSITDVKRCFRCGLINESSFSEGYCQDCIILFKGMDSWELRMSEKGWCKSLLIPGLWKHNNGMEFDERELTHDLFEMSLGRFYRETKTTPPIKEVCNAND